MSKEAITSWLSSITGTLISALILGAIGGAVGIYTWHVQTDAKLASIVNREGYLHKKLDRLERRDNYLERTVGRLVVQCLSRKSRAAFIRRDPK